MTSEKADAFHWLDQHMVDSLDAPDEAFDWIWMMHTRDWQLLEEAWTSRSRDWKEACAYILGSGSPAECVPLLRIAIQDECAEVAIQAACSLCNQILHRNVEFLMDSESLKRIHHFDRQGCFANFPEVQEVLDRHETARGRMRIILLEAIHYPPDGSEWKALKTRNPDWQTIESAIRRLDRDEWPFVWMHTEEPPEDDVPDNMFCVMGGRGEYDLTLYRDGAEIHFLDDNRSDEVIAIWESDQGSHKLCKNLCNDLSLVLKITHHFAESAELYSDVSWDQY